jgi:hypothetical protein
LKPLLKIKSLDSGGNVQLTSKYINFVKVPIIFTKDHMQSFKIVAYLLLGYFSLVEEEFVDIKGFLSLSCSFSWGCG